MEALNIADLFLSARLRTGDGERIAIHTDGGKLTYAEVDALASRYATALTALGVRQEERVYLLLPDGPGYPAALFGVLKLGAVAVMINPSLPAATLGALVDHGRPFAVVVHARHLETVEAGLRAAGHRPRLLVSGRGATNGHAALDDLATDEEVTPASTHRDDPAVWLFSGGTTGLPKIVVQTHGSFANTNACYAQQIIGYRPRDVTISVPKLYFGYATGSNLFFPFAVGGSAVLFPDHPSPEVLFDQIARHRPTILVNVPSMIKQMVDHPQAASQDLSCLRLATSAGEALPPALHQRWLDTFGVELLDGLGTAEMWHIFLSNRPGEVRPGTLGRAVPGFKVEVRDDAGRQMPPGEVGLLWVAGASRALGYWRNLPKTAEVFRGEWVVTGDLVQQDTDGFVTYVGRNDDALKVKGKWLLPAEVEACLASHDAVTACAIVGVADADGLTKPVAFVVVRERTPGLEQTLREFVLGRLEPYKHPREIILVDDLPRTHLGKVDRGALKRRAMGGVSDGRR